jgi:hypothetical protein
MSESPAYLPTPREIAAACAAIRQRWTPTEFRRRSAANVLKMTPHDWTPPQVSLSHCLAGVRTFVADAT